MGRLGDLHDVAVVVGAGCATEACSPTADHRHAADHHHAAEPVRPCADESPVPASDGTAAHLDTVGEVARRCGSGSAAMPRRHFPRLVRTTSTAYRRTFRGARAPEPLRLVPAGA